MFVQYVTLVPEARCDAVPLSANAAATTREVGRQLAAITERVAQESGALLLPADQLSRNYPQGISPAGVKRSDYPHVRCQYLAIDRIKEENPTAPY